MKIIRKSIGAIAFIVASHCAMAQDPAISGILAANNPIQVNETTTIEADFFNGSSSPFAAANQVIWTINLPPNIEALSYVFDDPAVSAFVDVEITPYDANDGQIVFIRSKPGLAFPGSGGSTIFVTVKGKSQAGPWPMSIQAESDPAVGTNNPGNDNVGSSITVQGVLPVTLVSFNAVKEGSSTNLTWATTEETNSDHFEVQHSLNAKNWAALATVKSHGESKVLRNYSYQHVTPSNGANYYRLRMVDKDETFAYSTMRNLVFDGLAESALGVFPNPASDRLFVINAEINKLKTLSIVSQDGKVLITSPVSTTGVSIKNLQPGLYLVKLLSRDGSLSTHKLVVSK